MKKKPVQQRSQAMVANIVNATYEAVTRYGIEGLTTAKVAELADVSIGSLYQYFRNKQELIAALIEHNTEQMIHDLQQIVTANPHASLDDILNRALRHGFQLFREDKVCFEIVKNWLSLPVQEAIDLIYDAGTEFGRIFFLQHAQDYPLTDLHVKSFIIINSTLFTMIRYMNNRHKLISEEQMIDGLQQMIISYIQSSAQQSMDIAKQP
ncbi:TetR/AcrR family transcriptional regulator [Agitococcus lubricus]|uniref:TetR family transcriptional regulator n=1 Tax=Agitococcus lubricus TaxID=1077255 RepID=A0A2T5J0I5_9GAMM|nr:TetR/AcrR family transcriptional regulator [Agitococcus lubricus]PTQ89849.1 TetR family transcriptional regulator [Agitococcus lubricus]